MPEATDGLSKELTGQSEGQKVAELQIYCQLAFLSIVRARHTRVLQRCLTYLIFIVI